MRRRLRALLSALLCRLRHRFPPRGSRGRWICPRCRTFIHSNRRMTLVRR